MASDVLGVNKPQFSSSVGESADDPAVRKDAIAKLQQMRKHLAFVQMSISTLEQALRSPGTLKTLYGAQLKKQLRDWVLSIVWEEAQIEIMLGAEDDGDHFRHLASYAVSHEIFQRVVDRNQRAEANAAKKRNALQNPPCRP
jgi:hypothetical protein